MILKKKSNHNAKHFLMDDQGTGNIHLLRHSNFPETMKNNNKKSSTWRKAFHLAEFKWPIFYDQMTVLKHAPNSFFSFLFFSWVFKGRAVVHLLLQVTQILKLSGISWYTFLLRVPLLSDSSLLAFNNPGPFTPPEKTFSTLSPSALQAVPHDMNALRTY